MIDLCEMLAQRVNILDVLWFVAVAMFFWVWIETMLEHDRDANTLEGQV